MKWLRLAIWTSRLSGSHWRERLHIPFHLSLSFEVEIVHSGTLLYNIHPGLFFLCLFPCMVHIPCMEAFSSGLLFFIQIDPLSVEQGCQTYFSLWVTYSPVQPSKPLLLLSFLFM